MQTGLVYDPRFLLHKTADSPECPERVEVILKKLQQDAAVWDNLLHLTPRPATVKDIVLCHSNALLDQIKVLCPKEPEQYYLLDSDTLLSQHSYEVALLAAGAALPAIDNILAKKIRNAFCLIRPPGHHATPTQAMGFCLFNNAAIAARYIQLHHHLKNILIIDWDVHHGNGTQDIFYADPSVFYFSLHESPFYPGTGSASEIGAEKGIGYTLNIPLPAGCPATFHRQQFSAGLQRIETIFQPDFIIISAGFDARQGDPLADLQLTASDYAAMTREVMQLADKYCEGRIVSVLEGGYVSETLGEAVHAHVESLLS